MLWVGQFGIADGEAREKTPWLGAFPDDGRGDEPSDLYLVVEPATEGSAEFCEELKEAIGDVFHNDRLSLTGGLLRALKTAHENLREWNRRSMKDHRVAAGVSCLAARTDTREMYLAQVAPASAAHYRNGELLSLQPSLPDASEPLGLYDEFWPQFSRIELEEGDRLLLLSPVLARAIPPEELTAVLAAPHEEALQALYRQGRALPNCAALLVAALPDAKEPIEPRRH
jgi:hypothetical protein